MNPDLNRRIRAVLAAHGKLATDPNTLADGTDLYAAGLTSYTSVNVMLGLEDEFDLEFPDELLTRHVFSSVLAIAAALLTVEPDLGRASA